MKARIPTQLSDAQLIAEVTRFASCEREAAAQLIAYLAELDSRRLYLGAGFSSLFAYCCEVLRLSEHETYNRIEAARAARRFPILLDLLAEGALNLTAVRLLAPHITNDNHAELLAAASHRSKGDVEELIARRFPRPDVASSVRKLPVPRAASGLQAAAGCDPAQPITPAQPVASAGPLTSAGAAPSPPRAIGPLPAGRRTVVAPLAAERYEIRFTVGADTREKLRRAQDLLQHVVPTGDAAEIVDRALSALLEELARKKFAATKQQPRTRAARPTSAGSRHVPGDVKRAVWLRDNGRCAFVAKSGRRCGERGFLEFHHVTPHGIGGAATQGNLALRCRAHNAYEAELFYGPRLGAAAEPWELRPAATRPGTSGSRASARHQ